MRLAHRLAIESDMIWADMVEANEFVPLAQKYAVMGVPKTIINEEFEIAGAVPEDVLVVAGPIRRDAPAAGAAQVGVRE